MLAELDLRGPLAPVSLENTAEWSVLPDVTLEISDFDDFGNDLDDFDDDFDEDDFDDDFDDDFEEELDEDCDDDFNEDLDEKKPSGDNVAKSD